MRIPYTITNENITVFHSGKVFNIPSTNRKFVELKEHLRKGAHDVDFIETIVNVRTVVERFSKGNVKICGSDVYYKGNLIRSSITSRLVDHLDKGYEVNTWLAFMENVMTNPSNDSRERLFDFLEKNGSPLTEDGHFLAFKRVRGNFLDHYTGKMDNSPGKIVQVDRSMVDSDNTRTCSHGLHVCASVYLTRSGYADSDGARTIVCKVNPRDVVAVPPDYDETKMRVCRYEVVSEVEIGSIHEVEEQDIAFGYGNFDDPAPVDDTQNDVKEAILEFLRNEIVSTDGGELEYEADFVEYDGEPAIEIKIKGDLQSFFADSDMMVEWVGSCKDMAMIIRHIVGENDPEMEFAEHEVSFIGVNTSGPAVSIDVYENYVFLYFEDDIEILIHVDNVDGSKSEFEKFYHNHFVEDDLDDDFDDDGMDEYEYHNALNTIGKNIGKRIGLRVVEVYAADKTAYILFDTGTAIDEVSLKSMVSVLDELSDYIYGEFFSDEELGVEEVVIQFGDYSVSICDNIVFSYDYNTITVISDSDATKCSNVKQAYDVWFKHVYGGPDSVEEAKYFEASNGKGYYETQIMEGIQKSGSLNQFARNEGLARSTVQGWVKKILG